MRAIVGFIIVSLVPKIAMAFCDPPVAPALTSEGLAREYQIEFRQDFERYFSAAQAYLICLEEERSEVMREIGETTARYDRFLTDSDQWNAE